MRRRPLAHGQGFWKNSKRPGCYVRAAQAVKTLRERERAEALSRFNRTLRGELVSPSAAHSTARTRPSRNCATRVPSVTRPETSSGK